MGEWLLAQLKGCIRPLRGTARRGGRPGRAGLPYPQFPLKDLGLLCGGAVSEARILPVDGKWCAGVVAPYRWAIESACIESLYRRSAVPLILA